MTCMLHKRNMQGIFTREGIGIIIHDLLKVVHITGDTYCETIENGLITCLKWQDKREVKLLSTFHTGDNTIAKQRHNKNAEGGTEEIMKPVMIDDYVTQY